MKFTILVDLSLVIITIHLVCLTHAQKYGTRFFEKNDLVWPRLSTGTPAPGVMKFKILVNLSFIITIYLVCLIHAQEYGRRFLEIYMYINLQFLVFVPYKCYIPNLVINKFNSVAFEPKMLTHNDGRQSIAIGHLSDPCDLKRVFGFELNCDPIVIYIKITNLLKMMEMKF